MKNTIRSTDRPWQDFTGGAPVDVEIPEVSMVEILRETASQHPKEIVLEYMGRQINYMELMEEIDICVCCFEKAGIKSGDSVLVALPNIPANVIIFYALNTLGARACMAHPQSAAHEIEVYLESTGARVAVTLDMFYGKFAEQEKCGLLDTLVICSVTDYLPIWKRLGFAVTKGRKIKKISKKDYTLSWKEFMKQGTPAKTQIRTPADPFTTAVVLFSGGTTSQPKGIELSSYNFNALREGTKGIVNLAVGDSIIAILPLFHGFGLGLCIHTCISSGVKAILIPAFGTKNYIRCLIKQQPNFIAGVPTLFESLLREKDFQKVSFHNLKGAYCGADTLPVNIKKRFDEAIKVQGGNVELKEGYGLTETVTACMISPDQYKPGSMGIPLANMLGKIVKTDTHHELSPGEEGEICISGPEVMVGYLNDEEATKEALRMHPDGRIWLHTGDMGKMDEDGYFYFCGRYKRVLKVSGMSVYPEQVEQVLESHPYVSRACVIGVPDTYQITKLKAFIVLEKDKVPPGEIEKMSTALMTYCRKYLIKWSIPRVMEFRNELPTTRVGKVAYTQLEKEKI